MNIAIIGGGASGLFAAVIAAEVPGCTVTVYERQSRVGRKLSATGNGRCNLSNTNTSPSRYHGGGSGFVTPALTKLDVEHTVAMFKKFGLEVRTEPDGKIYPYSDSALSVVDVLRFAADHAGVSTVTDTEITSVKKNRDGTFTLAAANGTYTADRVITACGGSASAPLGGTDGGYRILKSLGHTLLPQYPSLVQVKTDTDYVRSLKGVRADGCRVTLESDGRKAAESYGEVQFTEYGLSGPAVFDISRAVSSGKGNMTLYLDLFTPAGPDEMAAVLRERRNRYPERTAENFLTGMLQNRLGRVVMKYAGISANTSSGDFSENDLKRIAKAIKAFPFAVKGTTGLSKAQVTAGGIDTREFDPETMQSRLCPGIYACGEVLDVDGDCGGFNLQWAWSSGYLAGSSASRV